MKRKICLMAALAASVTALGEYSYIRPDSPSAVGTGTAPDVKTAIVASSTLKACDKAFEHELETRYRTTAIRVNDRSISRVKPGFMMVVK